jgi:hypothetical protein
MGLWDSIRRLGEAGRRVVEKIDALEEEVRRNSPQSAARAAAEGPSERVVDGGVEALQEMNMPSVDTADAETEIASFDLEPTSNPEAAHEDGPAPHEDIITPVEFGDMGGEITDLLEQQEKDLEDSTDKITGERSLNDEDTLVIEDARTDDDRTDDAQDAVRFRNSLGFSDNEVITLFRVEHYPYLPDVDDVTLYRMARIEEDILLRSMYVGHAFRDAWRRVVPNHSLWEAAFWFTGVHRDSGAQESLHRLETDWTDEAARRLGWAVWPFRLELSGAVAGLEDPAALILALDALGEALDARSVLIRKGPEDLLVEIDFKPVIQRGVFRFKGFRWLR